MIVGFFTPVNGYTNILELPMQTKKNKKVLVVDDDNDTRALICMMLEVHGYVPLSYSSAREAREAIKTEIVGSALLDVMMPETNGYEFLEELRADPRNSKIPVIMLTAKDSDDDMLTGYKLGADYYIPKPFSSEQLQYGLQLVLEAQH